MFRKIPVKLTKSISRKGKNLSLINGIGDHWYMKNIYVNIPPLNKQKTEQKTQENEDKIKRDLHMTNQSWND